MKGGVTCSVLLCDLDRIDWPLKLIGSVKASAMGVCFDYVVVRGGIDTDSS